MDGEAVIRALLVADAAVTALIGSGAAARAYPNELPEDAGLPALVHSPVSTVDDPTIDADGPKHVRSRVEVVVLASDLAVHQQLVRAVTAACRYQRGTIAGVSVVAIYRSRVGERLRDEETGVYGQPVDFSVTYIEP